MTVQKKTAGLLFICICVLVYCPDSSGQETPVKPEKPEVTLTPTPPAIPDYLAPAPQRKAEESTPPYTEGKPWMLRALEGVAVGAAHYNTLKQNDGRPQTPTSTHK